MLQYLNQKKGQSTLEYAILIVVIIGALLAVQVYLKRGIQGRFKSSADDIGDQYSDGNTNQIKVTRRSSNTDESFKAGSSLTTLLGQGEVTNTTENSLIVNTQQEFWGAST